MSGCTSREVFQFRIPGQPHYVSMVRHGIHCVACSHDLPDSIISDVEVSVSEAITNAIMHGCPRNDDSIVVVTCRLGSDKLVIDVEDEGEGFQPDDGLERQSDPMLERGRGLRLIRHLMDGMQVSRMRTGFRFRMVKKLQALATNS
ncbi:MAG: ATP-binding protein [Armatimonadetes bacterium]|nr:ATP-binding protein [Armatimonadota bacterium]